ncbi:serine hydrolase domain-containing protein [Pseudoalteromonas sp. MMG007]|uniref:serine hydrolase domain-containing protein n=1 Tax=Pseudoalteromonas sp. MMG007 TaxID=2822684 RepID=UPI001B394C61|nr:serine hydrolase domain-containing protein [Pseudoalteromonas sp. MMG007]MBQ4860000.1 beta-lactamase family protein [Pseudoalteromonas sp. MMG007]
MKNIVSIWLSFIFLFVSNVSYGYSSLEKKWTEEKSLMLLNFMRKNSVSEKVPSISVEIFNASDDVFSFTAGLQNVSEKKNLTTDSWMHLGSNTKAFTGLLAAKVVQRGLINWDTKIIEVFPELKDKIHHNLLSVNLLSLLNHTSGMAPTTGFNWRKCTSKHNNKSGIKLREDYVACIVVEKPEKVDKYLYSNSGYIVAAAMLERVTNLDWESMLLRDICTPLGIDCLFGWPAQHSPDYTLGYEKSFFGNYTAQNVDDYALPREFGPAGDVSLTVNDYKTFVQFFLRGIKGQEDFLNTEEFEFLLYSGLGKTLGVGWGSYVTDEGFTISKHTGSAGPFDVRVIIVKECQLAFTVMLNSDAGEVAKLIEEYILELVVSE